MKKEMTLMHHENNHFLKIINRTEACLDFSLSGIIIYCTM